MTEDLHKATRNLIRDVEIKDRRHRQAQFIFNMLIILLLLIGLIYQIRTFQTDENRRNNAVQSILKEVDQNKSLVKCIAEAFTANNYINSQKIIDKCVK